MALPRRMAVAFLALVMGLASLSGCAYRYRFETGLPPTGEQVSETHHHALFGWVSGDVFDLEQACPAGVAEFGSRIGFLNWLPALLTVGLYTPRTVYARCAEGEAS